LAVSATIFFFLKKNLITIKKYLTKPLLLLQEVEQRPPKPLVSTGSLATAAHEEETIQLP